MRVRGNRRVAVMFILVAILSLAAAVIPLLKERTVNVTFLGAAIVWLVIAVVVARAPAGNTNPPRA